MDGLLLAYVAFYTSGMPRGDWRGGKVLGGEGFPSDQENCTII